MAVTSQSLYEKAKNTYTTQTNDLKKRQEADEKNLTDQYNTAVSNLGKSRDNALREAYITRMQSQRTVPAMLRQQGINGGASETTLANINRTYQQARNAANDSYGQNKTSLENTYNTNLATLRGNYADRLNDIQDKQAALELEWAQYLADQQANSGYGGGGYSSGGSGSSSSGNSQYKAQQQKYNSANTNNYAWQNRDYNNKKNDRYLVSKTFIKNPNSQLNGLARYVYSDGTVEVR